jgi:hypothetical protein
MEPSDRQPPGRLPLFVLYTAILYASFTYDVFHVAGPLRDGALGFDSKFILTRFQQVSDGAPWWAPLGEYRSQFGLQGVAVAALLRVTGLEPMAFALLASKVFALLTAMVLAAFYVSITRTFGLLSGGAGVMLTGLSPVLLSFAPSLFWPSFLLFAPFVGAWCLYPWLAERRWGTWALLGAMYVLVLLRSLCGYEYVTTFILSPVAALFYHRYRAGRMGWRFLGLTTAVGVVGVAAFGTALAVHAAQLSQLPDVAQSRGGGVAVILDRARTRISNDPNQELFHLTDQGRVWGLTEPVTPLICFLHYFRLPAVTTPGTFPALRGGVPLVCFLVTALVAATAALVGGERRSRPFRALVYAQLVGLAASLSWQVAAVNHMCVHFILNRVVFHLPFLPLAFAAVGYVLSRGLARVGWDRFCGTAVAPAGVLLAIAGSLVDTESPMLRAESDRRTWADVRAHLDAGGADDSDVLGCVEGMRFLPVAHDTEFSPSQMAGSHTCARSATLITGWAFDRARPGPKKPLFDAPYPNVTFVVMQGNHAVPYRVLSRFHRLDLNHLYQRKGPEAGFTLIIPGRYTEADQPLRVFAVAEADRSRVRELTPTAATARR